MRSDLQTIDDSSAKRVIFQEFLDAGVINVGPGALDYLPLISQTALDFLSTRFRAKSVPNTSDLQSSGTDSKSLHFRAGYRGRVVHNGTAGIALAYAAWASEVARFVVPAGNIGVVKGFEQYLASIDEQGSATIYSRNDRWGVPGPWHAGGSAITGQFAWHFRTRSLSAVRPPWYDAYGPAVQLLPDQQYSDFPRADDLWWPAGSAASQNIHLLVPSGTMLRVFFVIPEQDVLTEVAAYLKGYIQSNLSPEMAHNVRTNY